MQKRPFTALIAGPMGSSKTVFVHQFLPHLLDMGDPIPDEKEVETTVPSTIIIVIFITNQFL